MFAASTALGRNGVILPMEADALDLSSYWPSLLSGDGQSWYALTPSIAFDAVGDVIKGSSFCFGTVPGLVLL